jgi:hypothetical protein
MAYASISGRARTSSRNPRSFAVCQRCGIWYNRVDLRFQFDWRGAQLQNLYVLVCNHCYDEPQQQLRAITLPADPVPIYYPSTEDFLVAESNFRSVSRPAVIDPRNGFPIPSEDLRITEDCQNRTTEPFGVPVGLNPSAVMPLRGVKHYGVPLSVLSVTGNGTPTVTVTCSAVHNLQPDYQVSVEGLSVSAADGFYSVAILTATVFTYQAYGTIPSEALWTPTTRIITARVGLPLGYKTIPKITGSPLTSMGTNVFELESGDGSFLLENGQDFLGLEA